MYYDHIKNLKNYIPDAEKSKLPAILNKEEQEDFNSEREILYKILFDMKSDMNDLKKIVHNLMQDNPESTKRAEKENEGILQKLYNQDDIVRINETKDDQNQNKQDFVNHNNEIEDTEELVEENLSIAEMEKQLINKALEKHRGKRKNAADELGISERTLYRKIKEYNIQ